MRMFNPQLQRGMSLVEVMVAMVLSLVIMAAVLNLFMGTKQTYRTSDAVARLQESGRFALDMIAHDLRMAGHQGCADPVQVPLQVSSGLDPDHPVAAVAGVEGTVDPDSLTVRHGAANVARLSASMDNSGSAIALESALAGLAADDVALIADCNTAEIFEVSSVSGSTINHGGLTKAYAEESKVMPYVSATYTVGDTGRVSAAGQPIFALYRNGEEMVEGVEQLQVKYGITNGSGSIRYEDWDDDWDAADIRRIVGVKVGLLMQSLEPVMDTDDAATYTVAGVDVLTSGTTTPVHAVDRRLRRVFETTVALRNH